MPPKAKLIPFKPLCRDIEYLTVTDIASRFDVEKNAVRNAIKSLPPGMPLRAKDIPPGSSNNGDRQCNPALFELASMATKLPISRWGELSNG
jgi:hypothetical protein